ncbi:F-box only protein 16 [Aulostomus maculatus]
MIAKVLKLKREMPQRTPPNGAKLQTKRSAWTPLNHPPSNSKVFVERRNLLAKWFDRWSDSQRRVVLQDFVLGCSVEQLRFLSLSVSRRLPLLAADFTCLLPRALCLYVFSFLDPRSLSRCAQVSWHWRSIVELDQLWMPKCLRLGWCVSFSPTPFEQGVWKRHYIQTVQDTCPALSQTAWSLRRFVDPAVTTTIRGHEEAVLLGEEGAASTTRPGGSISRRRPNVEKTAAPPPWRDSDRRPKDTVRFNYLDNVDPGDARTATTKSRASSRSRQAAQPDAGRRKTLSEATYKLRKAKSLMHLTSNDTPHHPPPPPPPLHHQHQTQSRPHWASHTHPVTVETRKSLLRLAHWNAGIRPGPVKTAVPSLSVGALRASQRSHRSAPSAPLFEVQPWSLSRWTDAWRHPQENPHNYSS